MVGVVVNPALLSDFPTDGDEVEKRSVQDEVARVVFPAEVEVGLETGKFNGVIAHVLEHGDVGKLLFGDFAEAGGELADVDHGNFTPVDVARLEFITASSSRVCREGSLTPRILAGLDFRTCRE